MTKEQITNIVNDSVSTTLEVDINTFTDQQGNMTVKNKVYKTPRQ